MFNEPCRKASDTPPRSIDRSIGSVDLLGHRVTRRPPTINLYLNWTFLVLIGRDTLGSCNNGSTAAIIDATAIILTRLGFDFPAAREKDLARFQELIASLAFTSEHL